LQRFFVPLIIAIRFEPLAKRVHAVYEVVNLGQEKASASREELPAGMSVWESAGALPFFDTTHHCGIRAPPCEVFILVANFSTTVNARVQAMSCKRHTKQQRSVGRQQKRHDGEAQQGLHFARSRK
jgi:hypothetical protein